jgi:hypothetical protein
MIWREWSLGDDPAFGDKECLLFGLRLIVSRQVQLTFEKRCWVSRWLADIRRSARDLLKKRPARNCWRWGGCRSCSASLLPRYFDQGVVLREMKQVNKAALIFKYPMQKFDNPIYSLWMFPHIIEHSDSNPLKCSSRFRAFEFHLQVKCPTMKRTRKVGAAFVPATNAVFLSNVKLKYLSP